MKVTIHAAKRYLERVLKKDSYSKKELYETFVYIKNPFKDIVTTTYKGFCPLPDNPNFVIAFEENRANTILPKEYLKEYVKAKKSYKYKRVKRNRDYEAVCYRF